ncbi:glycerol-3-phosphate dehydrogenase/oxidase [Paenibacillus eucommiae]|uniref:Glycerol-3-phosphate dehydrogenase n=1 Tax=Paenibacillus eucommiae TaxID=1355755 RepID=A0ABS4ISJ3_9BACL|nr:glycerol-3-phosphate dehydrogenase/oxidase [Paenibacillus eucommiae]MBP1990493.1 glycerol-3-phosphate dehydrogenase [Paenibacillus eucommiae]
MEALFTAEKREEILQGMTEQVYDLLVIGGGITGAGIALDAQSRGISTALVEMQDFAAGTSSRSTKLVHGGLRYLKQLEVKMVAEVGKERAIVYENGPHITTPEWMLLPFYEGGTFGKLTTSLALRVYDYLAGVKREERRQMFTAQETLSREPLLRKNGLKGGGYYVEYRTDDARLTIEVMKKAVEKGAKAVNYAKVEQLIYEEGRAAGVQVVDQISGRTYSIRALHVVNAAGPWVDTLREKDKSKEGKTLHLTKGVHLVFDHSRFPLNQAIYFDTPDKRMVFAIPREGKTYVGTTDTNYRGDQMHPRMTLADRDYLLHVIHDMFPDLGLTEADVESSWTGIRPLVHQEGKDPSEISRKDEIFISGSGLISIAGGKLTGYRKMAETVVNKVADRLMEAGHAPLPDSSTKHLQLSGGDVGGSANLQSFIDEKVSLGKRLGLTDSEAATLVRRYGSNIDRVFSLLVNQQYDQRAASLSPAVFAALSYAIEQEMTVRPADFFIRRTGALFFDIAWVRKWKQEVSAYMAVRLGWSVEQVQSFTEELEQQLHDAVVPQETV